MTNANLNAADSSPPQEWKQLWKVTDVFKDGDKKYYTIKKHNDEKTADVDSDLYLTASIVESTGEPTLQEMISK